ncbi:NADH dehydrogenase 1 beta subcomplex subunit 9 [Striga asiatica]|uniref:NADH dehydrogenase 1 beta subcomplex subunit 9 n=1 Tax=Striga asiatica TaxID=4170 RepID=A0A5A7PMC3_STRAF|nr:NADH dehydrogenase 1 beta subcomplex subunit 9 [Striga asiatica]
MKQRQEYAHKCSNKRVIVQPFILLTSSDSSFSSTFSSFLVSATAGAAALPDADEATATAPPPAVQIYPDKFFDFKFYWRTPGPQPPADPGWRPGKGPNDFTILDPIRPELVSGGGRLAVAKEYRVTNVVTVELPREVECPRVEVGRFASMVNMLDSSNFIIKLQRECSNITHSVHIRHARFEERISLNKDKNVT